MEISYSQYSLCSFVPGKLSCITNDARVKNPQLKSCSSFKSGDCSALNSSKWFVFLHMSSHCCARVPQGATVLYTDREGAEAECWVGGLGCLVNMTKSAKPHLCCALVAIAMLIQYNQSCKEHAANAASQQFNWLSTLQKLQDFHDTHGLGKKFAMSWDFQIMAWGEIWCDKCMWQVATNFSSRPVRAKTFRVHLVHLRALRAWTNRSPWCLSILYRTSQLSHLSHRGRGD